MGASLVAISPQEPRFSKELDETLRLNFDILADPRNAIAREFGLTFAFPDYLRTIFTDVFDNRLPDWNGDDSWELPLPARYVVDRGGIIRYAATDPDYTIRPEPEDALEVVRNLRTA